MSNSKLTVGQKSWLKQFKEMNPAVHFCSFPDNSVTVAIRATGRNMCEYSVSIASDTESKFRRKVGEYNAAQRMCDGVSLPATVPDHMEVDDIARGIAYAVGR